MTLINHLDYYKQIDEKRTLCTLKLTNHIE